MTVKRIALAAWALGATQFAMAQTVPLGTAPSLPLVEGGLLTVAAVGLAVGIRLVRAKQKQKR